MRASNASGFSKACSWVASPQRYRQARLRQRGPSMPCRLCGRWVDTSVWGQQWRDHGTRPLAPYGMWPTWGSYYWSSDGHLWTVAHAECARALRLFAYTPVLLDATEGTCARIEEVDRRLRLLRADIFGGRQPRDPAVRSQIDEAEEEISHLRQEIWRIDDLVRGVSDAVVHHDGGLDPELDVQAWAMRRAQCPLPPAAERSQRHAAPLRGLPS